MIGGKSKNARSVTWITDKGRKIKTTPGCKIIYDDSLKKIHGNIHINEDQKVLLYKSGITSDSNKLVFYNYPHIIPPFEYYNDLRDTLLMFIGGKRCTQKGDHKGCDHLSKQMTKSLKTYILPKAENATTRIFSLKPYHILARRFIMRYYTKSYMKFYNLNSTRVIECYKM